MNKPCDDCSTNIDQAIQCDEITCFQTCPQYKEWMGKPEVCPECKGKKTIPIRLHVGSNKLKPCPVCDGTGFRSSDKFSQKEGEPLLDYYERMSHQSRFCCLRCGSVEYRENIVGVLRMVDGICSDCQNETTIHPEKWDRLLSQEPEGLSELVGRICEAPTSVNMKMEIIHWLKAQLIKATE